LNVKVRVYGHTHTHTHTHTFGPLDGTSMNKECAAVDAVGSMPPL